MTTNNSEGYKRQNPVPKEDWDTVEEFSPEIEALKDAVHYAQMAFRAVSGLGDFESRICAYYCTSTWFMMQINPFPLLTITGPQATGKTTALRVDIRPLPGVVRKHFTARDVISRWDTIDVYSRATAGTAAEFPNKLEQRMPFIIRAIQVDGGSEFEAVFEEECQRRNIKLFVLPPRSPKLNGYVERAHKTHAEEFYEVTESSFDLVELRDELLEWERIYNTVRPHQSLGYLTPLKFLEQWQQNHREQVSCH